MGVSSRQVADLNDYQQAVIQLVVEFGRVIGIQKSVCEIYGLLFCSIEPLSMEQISTQLNMSLGSTSQGLKMLKELGAVKVEYLMGERKDHYLADFNFRRIVTKFLSDEMLPQLENTEQRLNQVDSILEAMDQSEGQDEMMQRVLLIRKLNKRAKGIIPAISRILSL